MALTYRFRQVPSAHPDVRSRLRFHSAPILLHSIQRPADPRVRSICSVNGTPLERVSVRPENERLPVFSAAQEPTLTGDTLHFRTMEEKPSKAIPTYRSTAVHTGDRFR